MTERLFKERKEHGITTDEEEWRIMQEAFLKKHDFLTGTGRLLRSVTLESQITSLINPAV